MSGDDVTIYHNPRCSKSRQTLALLREAGIEPAVIEYLETPPDVGKLRELARKLGIPPRSLVRTKEPLYAELGLGDAGDERLLEALAANPVLLERPIVVRGEKARFGRPPEAVRELF